MSVDMEVQFEKDRARFVKKCDLPELVIAMNLSGLRSSAEDYLTLADMMKRWRQEIVNKLLINLPIGADVHIIRAEDELGKLALRLQDEGLMRLNTVEEYHNNQRKNIYRIWPKGEPPFAG